MRLAVISIAGAALWLYRGLLFPADPLARYPWSSDAWGHLLKAEFLATEMARGNFYPNIFPDWYNGIQMLRYYAPAPYYLLVPLFRLTGDVFAAGNWFLFGCALLGAEAFLLFHRRIGLWPAVAGGLLSLALPDHLRVAFAEGNLPRVLASAVLPVALWFLLNLLDTGRRRGVLGLAVSVGLIVLSHAMMAAIFVVALGLFILVYWQLSDLPSSRSVGAAFLGLGAGLALPGWWLLPSLTGGITEIDQTAASEAIAAFPLTVSLNPVLRLGDREAFYVGLSFVFVAIIAILTWRRLTALTRSLLIVGLATALLSSTVLNPLYDALPMHHLFWPIRFLSFGGVALLLGSMSMVSDCSPGGHPQAPALAGPGSMSSERACSPGGHPQAPARDGSNPWGVATLRRAEEGVRSRGDLSPLPSSPTRGGGWRLPLPDTERGQGVRSGAPEALSDAKVATPQEPDPSSPFPTREGGAIAPLPASGRGVGGRGSPLAGLVLIVVLAIDFQPSLALVYGRPPRPEVVAVAEQLRERSGWRVAIADLSRLGSAPSYLFSAVSGREQVFGWAYQGTTTAPTLASINYALSRGFPVYAVDRLDLLGADDVIVLRDPAIPESFRAELEQRGYAPNWSLADLDLYHRDGGPRAFALQLGVLGIGEGTQNLAYLFPDVAVGSSSAVDDYDLAFLRQFRAVVLSRFDWRRRADAEQLIADYVALGGTVVVDLTGAPDDVLARQPKFLGVYAEPLTLYASPTLRRGDERLTLHPFAQGYRPWNTHTPQGLDRVDVTYSHFGAGLDGVVVGSRRVGPARVTFVGMNLIFHALTTGDPTAIAILADALGMRPEVPLRRQVVPLRDYQASQSGYRFHYELATPADLLIPVAHHSGTIVQIDGQPIASRSASRLVLMAAPAGSHLVEISTRPTAIHQAGLLVTLIGALVLLAFLMRPRATGRGGDGARRRARSLALSLTAAIALGLGTLAGLPLDIASAAGITLTPGSGVPGTTVQVDGAGFRGDRDVTITIDGATQPTSPSPCRTSAAGAFQCTFVVPGVAPGGHAVEARTTGQDRANATLTVLAPTSTATPTSVPTATVAPSLTPTSTVSSTSTSTPVPTLTSLPTSTATAASTSAATPTSSPTSAASATVAPSLTPTSTVPSTSTSTPVPTVTPPSTSTPTTAPPTFTSTPGAVIVMDGAFDDWVGRANVADPAGDASSTGDIATLYWGTNPNDATVYWMIERHPGSMSSTQYTVAVDMNNNGVFGETADRQIAVQYEPRNKNSRVDVVVRDGAGASISQSANDDWGESQSEGGRRVEFRASFADLGMGAGQAIRMVATSDAGDRAPDAGDIQWSPAPALGPLLAILVALGCVFAWREQRRREERASSVD